MPKAKAKIKTKTQQDTATIQVGLFDGTRNALAPSVDVLLRVRDGAQNEVVNRFVKGSSLKVTVPFSDNFKDAYTVLVSSDGLRDAGFYPVKVSPDQESHLNLMLVSKKADFRFLDWNSLGQQHPSIFKFLCCAGNESEAQSRYQELRSKKPASLASLLNLIAAMSVIQLPIGTPLDYFKRIEWDDSLAQDRFFGFADKKIVQQVKLAATQKMFAPEPHPNLFHGDATSSYKQIAFGEANVQLTFHENTTETIGGVGCIRIEPDIDYYQDLGAHALLEVIPNTMSHGLTDPKMVYVLRWIAGNHAGMPAFDPGYVLR